MATPSPALKLGTGVRALADTTSPGSLASVSQTLAPPTSSAPLNLFLGTSYAWSARASLDTQ